MKLLMLPWKPMSTGALLSFLLMAAGPAQALILDADLITFPLPSSAPADLDLADTLRVLSESGFTYEVVPTGGSFQNQGDPGDHNTWDLVTYRGTLTYGGFPDFPDQVGSLILVLPGFGGTGDLASFPADAGYVTDSFSRPLLFVSDASDGAGGQIPDLFNEPSASSGVFPAVEFPVFAGASFTLDYEVAIRAPLPQGSNGVPGSDFEHFWAAFLTIPEPATLPMLLLALLFGYVGRSRL